jgi:hypothetical protein
MYELKYIIADDESKTICLTQDKDYADKMVESLNHYGYEDKRIHYIVEIDMGYISNIT